MIAWWSVTFSSLTTRAERQHVEPVTYSAPLRYSGCAPTSSAIGLISSTMSLGQVARVGARVGERLVLLVQPLRRRERALGGEPVAVVRLPLQRRQVVEHRRFLALLFLLELGDRARPALAGRDDRERLLLGARSAGPWSLPGLPARGVEVADVGALAAGRLALERGRREGRVDQPVGLGLERPDLLLAAGDDRERRRLHAPERDRPVEGAAQPDRGRARGVHADDPVGLRARARRLLEARELLAPGAATRARSFIAALVIEFSHSRLTGFLPFAFSYR